MIKPNRLTNGQKFNYGLGEFSSNLLYAAISFYFLYFMINVAGLNPFYASIVLLITKITDGFSDYFMGVICDYTLARNGSRRMFMLLGAIPFGLFFTLLWVVPDTSLQLHKFIYYLCIYSLHDTFWTIVYIPYNSLLANISDDYDERTSLNGWKVLIANVGMIVGAAFFPLFAEGQESFFYLIFGDAKDAYFYSSLLFGGVAGILMLVCGMSIKEKPMTKQPKRSPMMRTIKELFSLKELRNTMLHYMFANAGMEVVLGVFVFYLSDCIAIYDATLVTMFMGIPLIIASISALFWVKISQRFSKHKAYSIATIGITFTLLSAIFIPEKGVIQMVIFCAVSGFFMAAIQIFPYAAIPDMIEVDEYYHGVRREGSYFGIVQFANNASSGIAMGLVSLTLGLFGYVEVTTTQSELFVQSSSAVMAVRIIFAFFPTILFIASIGFSKRANMSRERLNMMKKEIKERKNK